MDLMDFDVLDGASTRVTPKTVVTPAPGLREVTTVTHVPSMAATDKMRPEGAWGWEELRDYVVRAIETRHGPFPRDSRKEFGTFSGFVARWPDGKAAAIARFAFEAQDGMWAGAPISVNRFCRNSDAFFAEPIAARLGLL